MYFTALLKENYLCVFLAYFLVITALNGLFFRGSDLLLPHKDIAAVIANLTLLVYL